MQGLKKSLIVLGAMAATSAYALPQWIPNQVNAINFQSYENQYRTDAACAAAGGCQGAGTGPTGWQLVRTDIAANILVDDVFAGVVDVTKINSGQAGQWFSAPTDQFSGYFAQRVAFVDPSVITAVVLQFGNPTVDPFGILAAGNMFQLYTDSTTPLLLSGPGLTTAGSIASAIDGTYWGALGLDGTNDTYAYTVDNFLLSGADSFVSKFESSLNLTQQGASYNLFAIAKGNDPSESLQGGVAVGVGGGDTVTCSAADLASATVSCADFVGNADIKKTTLANSPWFYNVNDPLSTSLIPEPSSLALVGLSLLGLGVARRRKAA